jgi:hypothetical protein
MPEAGKRVSWVELYLDLVFVLAVGQLASTGDAAVFALSLAVIRLLLAFGYVVAEGGTDILRARITRAYLTSAARSRSRSRSRRPTATSSGSRRSASSRARCRPRTAPRCSARAASTT